MNDMIRDNFPRPRIRHLLALLAVLFTVPALSAAETLYDVEVVVFANDTGGDDEVMSPASGVHVPGGMPAGGISVLPASEYRLNNIRGGLAVSRGYRVLYHNAWRQPAYDRGQSVDFPVHTNAGLDGGITLIKERYLHLDVDLLLQAGGGRMYRLDEKRRIRSGELHYFDHPRLGVIALVTPYQSTEETTAPEPGIEAAPEDTGAAPQEDEPVEAPPADDPLTR